MKKLFALLLWFLMAASLFACAAPQAQTPSTEPTAAETPAAPAEVTAEAELSQEELIAAAKAEGTLNVYGVHSYIEKAAAAFSQKYGINVVWTQLGETELIEKVAGECAAQVSGGADLIFAQDAARLQAEIINPGYIYEWSSERLGALTGDTDMSMAVFEYSCKALIYNNELTGDTAYLTNIWQITDPQYKGQFSMKDPYSEGVNFNFFTMLTRDDIAAELADAYKAYYGKDIELTTENAGYEFIKAVYENGVVLGTSDTKISEAVGAKGQASTWVGFFSVQRFATAADKDLALAMNTEMAPFVGYYYPIRSIILNNGTHTNAAKLFVEYMLSEEGWQFWANNVGDYSANVNLPYAGDISFEQWQTMAIGEDAEYVYAQRAIVEDFISSLS